MNGEKNSFLGKKILYGFVIAMSSLIVLLSAVGVIGVWVVERPISDAAVAALKVVENSAVVIRQSVARVDRTLAALEAKTTELTGATQQLSQNVTDKGLVMVLLPEEKEQELTDTANSVLDTYTEIRESINRGLELYRSINRIPFVNLPGLDDGQVDKLQNSIDQIQGLVTTLRSGIADIRANVAGVVDKVTTAANLLNEEIVRARDALLQVDSRLAAMEELAIRLQQVIPGILLTIAVILSLVFVFLIFTQVEVIRLYIGRWRSLGQPDEIPPAEALAQPAPDKGSGPEIEPS